MSKDIVILATYFQARKLKLSTTKTAPSVFRFLRKEGKGELEVCVDREPLPCFSNSYPSE